MRLRAVPLARRVLTLAVLLAPALAPRPASAQEGGGLTLRTPPQSARVYARDGSLIAEVGPEVRTIVPLRSLPRYVPAGFVAVEDRRFYDHAGVDPVGVARAVRNTLQGDREGASTITQQLIGAMFPEQVDRREITAERKLREMRMAVELERRYEKDRILEAYLNQIYFGHGWYGIESAARHYFGKGAAQLALEEAAMLIAVVKGPGVYSPKLHPQRALARRNLVLDLMAQNGAVTRAEADAAKRRPIRLAPNHGYSTRPRWVIEQVRQFLRERYGDDYGTRGLRVWTTLDPVAQNAADSALVRGLALTERQPWFRGPRYGAADARPTPQGTPYLQGMVVSLDARTGEVLAMTGGRDWDDSQFNRVTSGRRQPGSSFKPFVYALALEDGASPASIVQDTALAVEVPGSPVYAPKNSDGLFRGPVTLRQALTLSINSVAVQLGMAAGLERVAALGPRWGLGDRVPAYPSSAIGAGAVTPLDLAGAYTGLANGGMRMEPVLVRRVADASGQVLFDARASGRRVVSPGVAFVVTDMLRDAAERGTGREARERLPAAVPMAGKTGTTDGATDVWYVGYTPEVVTAVWVGFDRPRALGDAAYGGGIAAPIWGEVMRDVYARRPAPAPWPVPPDVAEVVMDPATGMAWTGACPPAAERTEFFVAGTAPSGACVVRDGVVLPTFAPVPPDSLWLRIVTPELSLPEPVGAPR